MEHFVKPEDIATAAMSAQGLLASIEPITWAAAGAEVSRDGPVSRLGITPAAGASCVPYPGAEHATVSLPVSADAQQQLGALRSALLERFPGVAATLDSETQFKVHNADLI